MVLFISGIALGIVASLTFFAIKARRAHKKMMDALDEMYDDSLVQDFESDFSTAELDTEEFGRVLQSMFNKIEEFEEEDKYDRE